MPELDTYDLFLALSGLAVFGVALLPRVLSESPLSYPILYVATGALVLLLPLGLGSPDPLVHREVTERVAELAVIVALTGAGLKLNRQPGLRRWGTTWRLLAITMTLSIAAVALLGHWAVGLSPAAAMLLGAVLAPTDPVLASDVQVQEPSSDRDVEDPEVRFALTSEAGLNDGLAFPFTNAAIAMAIAGAAPANWIGHWVAVDLVYRMSVGLMVGYLLGRVFAHLVFGRPAKEPLASTSEGVVVLAATLMVYGATEIVGGYGFIAVFVAAVTLRGHEREHEYHHVLHDFSEQMERVLSALVLLSFGAAVAGGLITHFSVTTLFIAAALLLVIRPATGMLAQAGSSLSLRDKMTISFFGIRGIGSIYYLSHGLNEAHLSAEAEQLWSIVALVILASIVLHGVTATPWMRGFSQTPSH